LTFAILPGLQESWPDQYIIENGNAAKVKPSYHKQDAMMFVIYLSQR
jgi:hypothetical protein